MIAARRLAIGLLGRAAGGGCLGDPVLQPVLGVAAELDVGAAAGHVGRDRYRAGYARLRDDVGFLLVVARVQHLVRDRVDVAALLGTDLGEVAADIAK